MRRVYDRLLDLLPFPALTQTPKVNFIVCGTQKGGTTALDHYLRLHHQICMADKKEVHFFDKEKYFRFGIPNYRAYHNFFSPTDAHKVVGEATPIYMYWAPVAERLYRYNPALKLIVVLRNPIQRAFSHWNMESKFGNDSQPFNTAIRTEIDKLNAGEVIQDRVFSYISRGLYSQQLKKLYEYFPKEQVLVLKNESLSNDPEKTLQVLCQFLGIEEMPEIEKSTVFSLAYNDSMSNEDYELLKSFYVEDISELEKLLGWDCAEWLSPR